MINKYPQIALIYNRYKNASSKKQAVVEIRITHNKKQKYISTGIFLYPKQWKNNRIINHDNAIQLNQHIDKMLMEIRQAILSMDAENNIDIFQLPKRINEIRQSITTFIAFCEQRAAIRKYGKSPDSQDRYDRFIRFFKEYDKIIQFSDVNEKNIIAYDEHLKGKGLKPYSKWNNYHRFLNSFILDAIKENLLKKNPYDWINIDKGKNVHTNKYLTPEEFESIKKASLPTLSLERVRDLFIFQTYTCLSYSDLKEFNPLKVEKINDMLVYLGTRKKTNKVFTIPLLPEALCILYKYNNALPIISNVKYNQYLKIVAQAAGIDKPVSSHWARHTGATLLLNKGIDMKIISRICGHSSIKITEQIYAKLLDETVVEAIKKLQ